MPSVRFLGTGNAFHLDGRGSQAIWVEPDTGGAFLVDAGPTTMAAMHREGLDASRLDAFYLTHLHGDHLAGWPFLLLELLYRVRRSEPFSVFGPIGSAQRLGDVARACYGDLLEAGELAFPIEYVELPRVAADGQPGHGGLCFDTLPMDHHDSSLGFRLHLGARSLAVSGDTRWCPELEALARGSHLLILECTTVEPTSAAHVSLAELREKAGRLEAEHVVLVHICDEIEEALERDPIAGVECAREGAVMEF